jgi:hypothetical protein
MKNRKHHNVGTVPRCNRKIVETETKYFIRLHDHSLSWLGTSIKTDGVSLVEREMLTLPVELFQQCAIFFLFHFMDFGTVPTV